MRGLRAVQLFRRPGRRRLASFALALASALAALASPADGDALAPQIHTVAGGGSCAGLLTSGGPCDGIPATAAPINSARAVAPFPGGGFLYVDESNRLIRRVSPSGAVTTVAGNGSSVDAANGTLAVNSGINDPVAVAALPDGSFLVTEFAGSVVRLVSAGTPATATITTIAGTGTPGSAGAASGPATTIELNHPTDAEVSSGGLVLIADTYNNSVRLLNQAAPGATMSTIAGGGACNDGTGSCEGMAASAVALNHPVSVAPLAGGSGGYLIAEYDESAVRRVSAIDPRGTFTTVAGSPGQPGFAGDGGPAVAALLNHPEQVAATPDGGFLIADTSNERIRAVSASGTITTVAGDGTASYGGDGGAATAASLFAPSGVAPQPDGGFLIADRDSNAIRAVSIPPTSTIALTPAMPSGRNGWYVAPVRITVTGTRATQTVCTADPSAPPTVFDLIPASCPYSGPGANIGADGFHTVYAASVDVAGDKEIPVSASLKIDATPPTLTCASAPSFLPGARGRIAASVSDAGSGVAAASVSVPANTSHAGSHTATLRASDNAGNTASVKCRYTVLALTFKPTPAIEWRFVIHNSSKPHVAGGSKPVPSTGATTYDTVARLVLAKVPVEAGVTVLCRGQGCGFASVKCAARSCARRPGGEVELAPLLAGKRLAAGVSLTIRVTRLNTVGRAWMFSIRSAQSPALSVACLKPGSSSHERCPAGAAAAGHDRHGPLSSGVFLVNEGPSALTGETPFARVEPRSQAGLRFLLPS
jgi:hypothetical protein